MSSSTEYDYYYFSFEFLVFPAQSVGAIEYKNCISAEG